MRKGIVMDIKDKKAIVMTPDGQFVKVRRVPGGCEIGDEIAIPASGYAGGWNRIRMTAASAFAAAIVCLVMVFAGVGGFWGAERAEAVAYVAMDFNPSVELGINEKEVVVTAEGLNPDGEQVVAHAGLIGLTLEQAAVRVIETAKELDFLNRLADRREGNVVITVTVVNESSGVTEARLNEVVGASVKQQLRQQLPESADSISVDVIEAPVELREEARSMGVSPGTMAVLLLAEEQGYRVTKNGKSASIDDIAKEVGGIGKLTQSDGASTKERLKELVKSHRDRVGKENRQKAPVTSASRGAAVVPASKKSWTNEAKSRKTDENDGGVREKGKGFKNDRQQNRKQAERRNGKEDRDARNGFGNAGAAGGFGGFYRDAAGIGSGRAAGNGWSDRGREDRDRNGKAVREQQGSKANGGTYRNGNGSGGKQLGGSASSNLDGQYAVWKGGDFFFSGLPRPAVQEPQDRQAGQVKKGDENSDKKFAGNGDKKSGRNDSTGGGSGGKERGADTKTGNNGPGGTRAGTVAGNDGKTKGGNAERKNDGGRNVPKTQDARKDQGSANDSRGGSSSRDKGSDAQDEQGSRKDRESAAQKRGDSNQTQGGDKDQKQNRVKDQTRNGDKEKTQGGNKDKQEKRQDGNKKGQGNANQNAEKRQDNVKGKHGDGGREQRGGGGNSARGIWG